MTRWGKTWNDEDVERQLAKFKTENRAAVRASDPEQARLYVVATENEGEKVHSRYRVCVSYRSKKPADPTGRSHKAAVDGLVRSGILLDDSSKYVEFRVPTEEKCKAGEAEATIIEVWEIADE